MDLQAPTDKQKNLEYRLKVLRRGKEDEGFARSVRQMLAECTPETIRWWLTTFCWIYDPMRITGMVMPFIVWDFQFTDIITPQVKHINIGEDILFKKSRKMGFTWTTIGVLCNYFLFYPEPFSSMLISRNENLVEDPGDPDALFWKFDYLIKRQPLWLVPGRDTILSKGKRKLHRENSRNGAVTDGEATTQHMSAGGRRNVIMLDEFARVERGVDSAALNATRDATPCRIFGSTTEGRGTEFYKIEQSGTTACIYTHWSKHPEHSKGLYKVRPDGTIEHLDNFEGKVKLYRGAKETESGEKEEVTEEFYYPDDYPFRSAVNDSAIERQYRLRSPWFDSQCNRRPSVQEIARALEMDDGKAGEGFFDEMVLERVKENHAQPPLHVGYIDHAYNYVTETVEVGEGFVEDHERGNLMLWCELMPDGRPPQLAKYVMGCDISRGTGASNSTVAIYNAVTKEQVGEVATPHMNEQDFAQYVVAIAKWFGGVINPVINWEVNGPGNNFGPELKKLGWYHIHRGARTGQKKLVEGWHSNTASQPREFSQLRSALARGEILPKSKMFLDECAEYVTDNVGRLIISRVAEASSGARESHGDRVTGHVCAMLAMEGIDTTINPVMAANPPEGSIAWLEQREKRMERQNDPWEPIYG